MRAIIFATGAMLLLAACQNAGLPAPDSMGFVRARGKVITVDPTLGNAVLQVGSEQVRVYWQTEETLAGRGSVVDSGWTRPKVGAYQETTAQNLTFDAQPGDTIDFIGMKTGNELFLRSMAVVSH